MSSSEVLLPSAEPRVLTIWQAIPQITGAVAPIAKARTNPQQGYKFRGVDDVYAVLNLLLARAGVSVLPSVLTSERTSFPSKTGGTLFKCVLRVQYELIAADGSTAHCTVEGEGMDSGDKSTQKALSMAYKYMAFQVFCIPTGEKIDTEEDSPEVEHKNGDAAPAATISAEDLARIQSTNFETFKTELLATKTEADRIVVYAKIKLAHDTKQISEAHRKLLLAVANTVSAGLKPEQAKA